MLRRIIVGEKSSIILRTIVVLNTQSYSGFILHIRFSIEVLRELYTFKNVYLEEGVLVGEE